MGKVKTDAKVLRVIDGDTLEVAVKIRFSKIDAPETKGVEKPLGMVTKEWLKERLEGKHISLEIIANDVYHRLLADVYESSSNVGEEMLGKKLVKVYTAAQHNDGRLDG